MKKPIYMVLAISVMIFVMLFASVAPVYAFRPGPGPVRGGVWFGPGWGPWWWGPLAYPFYDYPRQPIVIEQQPPVYEQQTQQPEEQYYWYYCSESKTYYPYVKQCAKGWMKVVPTLNPPQTPTPAQPKGGE
jgi:hypothetical protein